MQSSRKRRNEKTLKNAKRGPELAVNSWVYVAGAWKGEWVLGAVGKEGWGWGCGCMGGWLGGMRWEWRVCIEGRGGRAWEALEKGEGAVKSKRAAASCLEWRGTPGHAGLHKGARARRIK